MLNVKIDPVEDSFTYWLDKNDPENCITLNLTDEGQSKYKRSILFFGIVWYSLDIATANSLIKIARDKANTCFIFKLFYSEVDMQNQLLVDFRILRPPVIISCQNSNYSILGNGNIPFDELRNKCCDW